MAKPARLFVSLFRRIVRGKRRGEARLANSCGCGLNLALGFAALGRVGGKSMLFPLTQISAALGLERLKGLLTRRGRRQNDRNAAVAGLSAMLNPVIQFVATPLIFHKLGATSFGIWALITSVTAVSGLASMGLGDAATKYVALYRARSDPAGVRRVIRCLWTLYFILGALASMTVLVAAPWIASTLFHLEGQKVEAAITALRIASIGILLRFLYGVSEAAVRGYERYDTESLWATISAVLTSVIAVTCVQFGGELISVVLSGVAMTFVSAIGLGHALTRLMGSWKWTAPLLDPAAIREVFGFGIFSWLQNVNGLVALQLDRVVIGAWLGAAAAGYYSVCLQVVQTAHVVLCRTCAFLFPLVVKHHEENKHDAMWSLFKEGMLITTIVGWFFSCGFIVFGHEFLRLWMGAEFAAHSSVLLKLLGAYNAFLATSIVPFFFMNATGLEKQCTWLGLLSTGCFLVSAFFLIRRFGTVGAPLARFCMVWECVVYGAIMVRSLAGDRRWISAAATIAPTTAAVLVVGIFEWLVPVPYASAFILRLLVLFVATLTCVGLAVFVYRRFLRFEARRGDDRPPGRVLLGLEGVGKLGDA